MNATVSGQQRIQRRYCDILFDRSGMKVVSGPCKQLQPKVSSQNPDAMYPVQYAKLAYRTNAACVAALRMAASKTSPLQIGSQVRLMALHLIHASSFPSQPV
jgi:hypothetical protein